MGYPIAWLCSNNIATLKSKKLIMKVKVHTLTFFSFRFWASTFLLFLFISCTSPTDHSMNRLQHETSPYLLQHAGNPVDWYPWGEEALQRAREEDKPIIVSIGYSTCHWCHVMERESFENEEVAAYMNEHFVCIKVDREERPDVDQVYMEACQAISGSGGWPLNAFLLPDARPFYAGTYFPPAGKYNRPGWMDLLEHLNRLFQEERGRLAEQAEQLTGSIGKSGALFIKPPSSDDPFAPVHLDTMLRKVKSRYDTINGGFGGAPKFPMSQSLELLLDFGLLHQDDQSTQLAEHAMLSMIRGGIYDQLGGGFARYTVDGAWRVPHFEKMLYDNALLLRLLGKLQMTRPRPEYLSTIVETVDWLEREMLSPSSSFYAALDADSEGVEGKFYTWTYEELEAVLEVDELTQVQSWLGASQGGNWEEEHTNIFYRPVEVASADQAQLSLLKNKLFVAREDRIRPSRDEKIILQWNALLISGLTYCYRATRKETYRQMALQAMAGLEKELRVKGKWHRNYKDGRVGQPAFLDDYAALIAAQMDVYDITYDADYLHSAKSLVDFVLKTFGGAEGDLFFLRPPENSELPVATLDLYDNALPSGNGLMLHNLLRLGQLTGETSYVEAARSRMSNVMESVQKYPTSFANWGRLALLLGRPPRELIITGPNAIPIAEELTEKYRPDLKIVAAETDPPDFPILKDRYTLNELQLFLCENQTCRLPVRTIEELDLD